MEACCHPYHNELSRGQRGGRPRMYFEGNNVDNDAVQGLLDLLRSGDWSRGVDERWALIVISKSGGTLETAAAFRLFLSALQDACGADQETIAKLVIPITGTSGKLFDLSEELGCRARFPVPDGVGGRFSVFSAVGLLPAAVLGLDVVRLLQGAVAANQSLSPEPRGRQLCAAVHGRFASDGNQPICTSPRAVGLVEGPRGIRSMVRSAAGRKPGQRTTGGDSFDRGQYARSAFSRSTAPGRSPGQDDHQCDCRPMATRSAARRSKRTQSGRPERNCRTNATGIDAGRDRRNESSLSRRWSTNRRPASSHVGRSQLWGRRCRC